MPEPKTVPTTVPFARYLATVDAARREDCRHLAEMMEAAAGAPPVLWGDSIVGFGTYQYVYARGRPRKWPVLGFSPRKGDLTLYLACGLAGREALLARLGKHRTGKGCLYLKRLADVDLDVLRELIAVTVADTRKLDRA